LLLIDSDRLSSECKAERGLKNRRLRKLPFDLDCGRSRRFLFSTTPTVWLHGSFRLLIIIHSLVMRFIKVDHLAQTVVLKERKTVIFAYALTPARL